MMRINKNYSFYYLGIAKLLVLGIFPLSALVYLNLKIYKGLKFPPSLNFHQNNKMTSNVEKDWAKVLTGIVVIFIVCHTFRVVIEIDNMIKAEVIERCFLAGKFTYTLWSIIVDPLSEIMMVFNSSINMLIYTCLSKRFRNHLLFCNASRPKNVGNCKVQRQCTSPDGHSPNNCQTSCTNMLLTEVPI